MHDNCVVRMLPVRVNKDGKAVTVEASTADLSMYIVIRPITGSALHLSLKVIA